MADVVTDAETVLADQRYICILGRAPSAGVLMLALLRPPASCASALIESFPTPPRPKLFTCALPAASLKPES